ncbi:MAG: RNA polymerase subunit sigma [Micavibrio sp.]|nr:RNA polymerase subunit sigma [Micavibrio sp.]
MTMYENEKNKDTDAAAGLHPRRMSDSASGDVSYEDLLYDVGQNKDKDSFIALFNYFAPRIKSFLLKGGASETKADELAQETMLNVWNKAKGYDPTKAAASTWIFTIARNKRIDALRKKKYYSVDLDNLPELEDETDTSPIQNAIDNEETHAIAHAIHNLPAEQADLIKRSYFEEKTHQEIADETGLPLGTVKSRIRIALKRLRQDPTISELWT